MKFLKYCTKTIEYSFYALFFLVPLVFSGDTSELFELNKMWLTFYLTIIISAAWIAKMIIQKRIVVQRTPLDILLLLFLVSQIISSIFSLDQQVSWWGYYSRFNGGLLSTICYVILYYAFASNLRIKQVWKTIFVSLFSGLAVSLWGLPSHFGADPTCLVFRGTFDTSCWTYQFQPTVRTFSTLGQPEWLAAYMAFLLPIAMAVTLKNKKKKGQFIGFLLLTILFYLLLTFSNTRAGFLAFWAANIFFWAAVFIKKLYSKQFFLKIFLLINLLFVLCNFLYVGPIGGSLTKFTWPEISKSFSPTSAPAQQPTPAPQAPSTPASSTVSSMEDITDSGVIRLIVWNGAIKAWENNPIFGTGVETFAFAYYKYKSPAHNLTSEWDYLYNKAHNEYLNYLATTGIFGLGTYLSFIGLFFFLSGKWFIAMLQNKQQEKYTEEARTPQTALLVIGIVSGYITMLISNFFGFSVVIINLYIFLAPLFVLLLLGLIDEDKLLIFPANSEGASGEVISPYQWTAILFFVFVGAWMIFSLVWYRQADIAYALGSNLDKVGQFPKAYPQLVQAVQMEPGEAVYQDELSINLAALAANLYAQKDTTQAVQAAKNAIALSDDVVMHHPNNVVYWKDRVRLFYTLSATDQADAPMYLQNAVQAINTAKTLAPTDAKISYNQGVLYGQAGDVLQGIQILNDTIKLKPDYNDAYIALGLFYHQAAIDQTGKVVKPDMQQKAISTYEYLLTNLDPSNKDVKKSLELWRSQ
jgi:putative inorganic carbon (HCO3(-)) transporter